VTVDGKPIVRGDPISVKMQPGKETTVRIGLVGIVALYYPSSN
jgi:hypothetical protein